MKLTAYAIYDEVHNAFARILFGEKKKYLFWSDTNINISFLYDSKELAQDIFGQSKVKTAKVVPVDIYILTESNENISKLNSTKKE